MFRVFNCLTDQHDLRLVVLAGGVCLLASVVTISLFGRANSTSGRARFAWLVLAGSAAGCGIWATHFIAMLAYEPSVAVAYDIGLTILSLGLAATITGGGLSLALGESSGWRPVLAGAIIGGGVASMHYTGMFALQLPGHIQWHTGLAALSVLLGMALGAASMVVAVQPNLRSRHILAAVLFTLAIVSHHFTAMGAVEIVPDPTRLIFPSSSMSAGVLALGVACAAVLILGLSLAGSIADRKMQERDVQLITAVNNMPHGVVMFDPAEHVVVCNDRYLELYGLSQDSVKRGMTLHELICLRRETGTLDRDPTEYRATLLRNLATGETTRWVAESENGRAIAVSTRPMPDGSWVATFEDVTDRRQAEQRIAYLAHHDVLSGLPNRAAFNEELQTRLEQAKNSDASLALLCVDLDRFKEINDVFGHVIGDGLLQEVARRLKEAADEAFVARLGGDEFALISRLGIDPAEAAALGERLLAAVCDDMTISGQQLRIGISVGIALFPGDGTEPLSLVANADAALYRAKAEGRGTIRFFEADMDKRLRERRALQHDLRSAIERGEIKLYYQPQASIGGEVIAFEALMRWQHPQRGLVPPSVFIPLAEESGIIIQLGEWALREASREAASWREPIRVAVNLSPIQFRHGDLPALVHTVLLETGLPGQRLELEITEGVLMDDFERAVSVLRRLKALGVQIAMDDFGTGYSSLSYLQAFPFDKIKIDQAFISNVSTNPQSAAIVRAVIGLARGLQVPVVAEGVETKAQLDFLSAESCDEVQGYFIGRPQPIEGYASLVNGKSSGEHVRSVA